MHGHRVIEASAPGKLMIMGEHAVLHGHLCLVAAVNRRVSVTLTPRDDDRFLIHSELGEFESQIQSFDVAGPLRFILQVIRSLAPQQGFEMTVKSEFTSNLGLGSSAAVTVAATAALSCFIGLPTDRWPVFRTALEAVREVQGTGSGADVAASVWGGLVRYRQDPCDIKQLSLAPPICAIYSGSKEKTVDVIRQVADRRARFTALYDGIYREMDRCVRTAVHAVETSNWVDLGEMLNVNQGLMDAIGVSNKRLSQIVYDLRSDPTILGAKISGSGLGDCVVGLGTMTKPLPGCEFVDLEITSKGITVSESHLED